MKRILPTLLAAAAGLAMARPPFPALLPSGTELAVRFPSALAGGANRRGERVVVQTMAALAHDGCVVLPAFSRLAGHVAASHGGGLLGRPGHLLLRFDSLEIAPGSWVPVRARLDSLEYVQRGDIRDGLLSGDGRSLPRMLVPVAVAGSVDLDGIPLLLIGGWELISRGASATILAGEVGWVRLEETLAVPRDPGCRPPPDPATEPAPPALPRFAPYTGNRSGSDRGDPINLILEGTAAHLDSAFVRAGWTRAERPTPARLVRAVAAVVAALPAVDGAPVSTQYFEGRPQDMAFEIRGPNARIRDHLRVWRLEDRDSGDQDRILWVAAATKDVGVRFLPWQGHATHRIDGHIDRERGYVAATLEAAGCANLLDYITLPGARTRTRNMAGQTITTDGRAALLAVHSCRPER